MIQQLRRSVLPRVKNLSTKCSPTNSRSIHTILNHYQPNSVLKMTLANHHNSKSHTHTLLHHQHKRAQSFSTHFTQQSTVVTSDTISSDSSAVSANESSSNEQLLQLFMNTTKGLPSSNESTSEMLLSTLRHSGDIVLKQLLQCVPKKDLENALTIITRYFSTITIDEQLIHLLVLCCKRVEDMEAVVRLASDHHVLLTLDMYNDMMKQLAMSGDYDSMVQLYAELVQDEKRFTDRMESASSNDVSDPIQQPPMTPAEYEKLTEEFPFQQIVEEEVYDDEDAAEDNDKMLLDERDVIDENGNLMKPLKANTTTFAHMLKAFESQTEMVDVIFFDCMDLGVPITEEMALQFVAHSPKCRLDLLKLVNESLSDEQILALHAHSPQLLPNLANSLKTGNRAILSSILTRLSIAH